MKRLNIELVTGIFLILGLLCLSWMAIKLGDVDLFGDQHYTLQARFVSSSGLKEGAHVEVAGVRVGKVETIKFDPETYESVVYLSLPNEVRIQEDTIAAIRTSGIIGDRFIKVSPGGSEEYLSDGDEILDTESSINLEELISKYIFETDR